MSTETLDSPVAPPSRSWDLGRLEATLGYVFKDRKILESALVHSSAAAEQGLESNQTLEFLGDAVLDLAVGELIMRSHPEASEGDLTRMRATLVSAEGVALVADTLRIGKWLRLGKGEDKSGGRRKPNILADTYEAILGAVFLDGGYNEARAVVQRHFAHLIRSVKAAGVDHKTDLQEFTQKRFHAAPTYTIASVSGPDHERFYEVELLLKGEVISRGSGSSRKIAEQAAARTAAVLLRKRNDD